MIKRPKRFGKDRGYTKQDWDDVSYNPEWTPAAVKKAKPFSEAFPELAESIRRARGRPPLGQTKKPVTIRLDTDVIAKFKSGGPGWQTRINDALKRAKVR